jgi:hypothetical protein
MMRTLSIMLLWCGCCTAACGEIDAGGFFRRVPEVGEWARYDLTIDIVFPAKPDDDEFDVPAMVGGLTLKCVGEEAIEEVRHLWLEARMNIADPDGTEHVTAVKVLVPANEIAGSDLTAHAVRAWCVADKEQVLSMDVAGAASLEDPAALTVLIAFPASGVSSGRRETRTMTIDGEEVRLTAYELGDLPNRSGDDGDMSGEAVWWPGAEYAFGIAAAELRWTVTTPAPEEMTVQFTSRMNLVATGTDAVSELPDHN